MPSLQVRLPHLSIWYLGSSAEIAKRRVILTITADPAFDQRMIRVCNSLAESGFDVLLVGMKRWGGVVPNPASYKHKRLLCPVRKGPLFYVLYNSMLLLILLFSRRDIFVAIDLDTILPNRIAAGLKGKRLVFDAHEYFTEVPELAGQNMVKRVWENIGRLCVPGVNLCYTVSASLARELGAKYNKHFHVIMNTPELKSATINGATDRELKSAPVNRKADRELTIIYQGHLNPGRGLEEAVMAIKGTDTRLLIAGDGPLRSNLEKLVSESGVEDRVNITGMLERDTLEAETRRATIGLNMLDASSKSYYLSLSNKFLNYIHAGIPQICADFPEYRNINKRWEVAVFSDYSAEALKQAIELLSTDNEYYDKLRSNCAAATLSLNWQIEGAKLTALFNEL